jgi:hypothetical protein
MTPDESEVRNADAAALLLRDEMFGQVLRQTEAEYLRLMLELPPTADLERYRLCEAIKTARAVKRHLETYVETGKLARRQIEELGKRKSFF